MARLTIYGGSGKKAIREIIKNIPFNKLLLKNLIKSSYYSQHDFLNI